MKTLKDVVKEHSPEHVNEKYKGGVYDCPEDYPYLSGHYFSDECQTKKNGEIDCDKCWMQPYLIPEEGKTDRDKNDREKIIDALKTMKQICVEERERTKRSDCNGCNLFDICSRIDDAFDGSEFFALDIDNLPEK